MVSPARFAVPGVWLAATALAPAQVATQSARTVAYDMTVEVDSAARTVAGTQIIRWRNATTAPTDELRFHLYWNAFRDLRSTMMRESEPAFRAQWRPQDHGHIELQQVGLVSGDQVTPLATEHVQPDDGNPDDATVLRAALPRPVGPGEEIVLATRFRALAPKALRRTGWLPGGGMFLMHWYPALGVLQQQGDGTSRWNCHQFHANTEFFADFGSYRVAVTLPSDCVVGATGGVPIRSEDVGPGRTLHVFEQHDVHNFALVLARDFARHVDTFGPLRGSDDKSGVCRLVAARMGVPVETFDLPATEIVLLLRPEHDTPAHRRRHLEAVKVGLEFFGLRYGPYPYRTITAVDPGRDAQGRVLGGGMEYPMLITCGSPLFLHARELSPEGVTVHEFGHQYWYGLSANNEFEESWLDEGLDTYSEGRAQWLGYRRDRRLAHGADTDPAEVSRMLPLWPLANSRGPWIAPAGLEPRRDLPGLWRVPGWQALDAIGFRGTWLPESPLLELMRTQAPAAWHPGVHHQHVWRDRQRFLGAATPDQMVRPGWDYADRASYLANSYQRPATVLRTLERLVEPDRWWTFLREFHARARFGHPTTADFIALLEERCGQVPADYFRSAIRAGATVDYGIRSVAPEKGRTTVVVQRRGTMLAQVKVRFTFERGAPEVHMLSASDPGPVWRFVLDEAVPGNDRGRLVEAWIDPPQLPPEQEELAWPAGAHLLDENLLDNAWRLREEPAPARHRALRALLQAQCELSFAGLIG